MAAKPPAARHYVPKDIQLVRSACLTLATYLGSFLDDLVIVGGLVPTLIVEPGPEREPHVGTQDLDLGLAVALLEHSRYAELVAHLRGANFAPDQTGKGKPANHRWKHKEVGVTVDFLIAPTEPRHVAGGVRVIDSDLSAVLAPGLPLAFRDRRRIALTGQTLRGEEATREVWVCGAGAFMVLKALALRGRGENKDAYDLFYVLENFGREYVAEVANALRPLLDHPVAQGAVRILEDDCSTATSIGPTRAAAFLDRDDDEYKADCAGAIRELLRLLRQ